MSDNSKGGMLVTPQELFDKLSSYEKSMTNVCEIKARCACYHSCSQKQTAEVLDFDKVKEKYCSAKKMQNPLKSVDAVCVKGDGSLFFFVEKKSWTQFFRWNSSCNEQSIQDASDNFSFQKKYDDSVQICRGISECECCLTNDNHAFLFLTDVENEGGIQSFAANLAALATTASVLESKAVGQSNSQLERLSCDKKRYVFCKDFDGFVAPVPLKR